MGGKKKILDKCKKRNNKIIKHTEMKTQTILQIIGAVAGITALALAWIWFGWKLPLVLFLALLGNNLQQNPK